MLRDTSRMVLGATALVLAVLGSVGASGASAQPMWLCRPGVSPDPCSAGLSTTLFSPSGTMLKVTRPKAVANPKIDCFYVYPTVSDQTTTTSNLTIDPVEQSTALEQAARYSQYCKVYAPMYRQLTVPGLEAAEATPPTVPTLAQINEGYSDVVAAWKYYLAHYNHGRGVVLLGHSQGSGVLIRLMHNVIDPNPTQRRLLVSAIVPGGNVLVKKGSDIGGDFQHIPACQTATELHCVIGYSTFDQPVPTGTLFGLSPSDFSELLDPGLPEGPAYQVLCSNPAAIDGSSSDLLDSIMPEAPFAPGLIAEAMGLLNDPTPQASTVFVESDGDYSAHCSSASGANVLQVTPQDAAPTPTPSPTPIWGLHLLDVNLSLGTLVDIVGRESAAWAAAQTQHN